MFRPNDQKDHFDPDLYLKQYYGDNAMNKGLKIILYFLPNIAARLKIKPRWSAEILATKNPENSGETKNQEDLLEPTTLLDVGSGPAIYMALGLRRKVDLIVLSDYAEQNRKELIAWKNGFDTRGGGHFDWTPITRAIAELEGAGGQWEALRDEARRKVCNVAHCDVHNPSVLLSFDLKKNWPLQDSQTGVKGQSLQFDVVSSIFCVEYATTTFDEYKKALKNVCSLIKPGGYLILGGAYEESFYSIGPKKFACHFLTENQLFEALKEANIETDDRTNFAYYLHDNAFVTVGVKKSCENH